MTKLVTVLAQLSPYDVDLPKNQLTPDSIGNVLRVVFGVAGAVAFLMVTLAGLKFVLSQGNPQETAKAKNAIIDALIGLVIAMSAFTIVSFLLGEIG